MTAVKLLKRSAGGETLVDIAQKRPVAWPRAVAAEHPDFALAPRLVIWEVTRACALACAHCRADAVARRDPRELTTEEGCALLREVAAFGVPAPFVVLTGGDPMWRRDLAELVGYGTTLGLTMALTPSGTAAVTHARLRELRDAGLKRLAVSLDAADAATHDGFRGVKGSYAWTERIIRDAIDLRIPLQINSTVTACTLPGLRALADYVSALPIELWAMFFLVQIGRGASLRQISAEECEEALRFLAGLAVRAPFAIKTTEAPHYRRVVAEMNAQRNHRGRFSGVNDGNGFVFVDHIGDICPSGFLPMARGNVRTASLGDVYRADPVFRLLRDPDALGGRCGRCPYRSLCGGSRSRAYAASGDFLAEDPLCAYDPGQCVESLAISGAVQ